MTETPGIYSLIAIMSMSPKSSSWQVRLVSGGSSLSAAQRAAVSSTWKSVLSGVSSHKDTNSIGLGSYTYDLI